MCLSYALDVDLHENTSIKSHLLSYYSDYFISDYCDDDIDNNNKNTSFE